MKAGLDRRRAFMATVFLASTTVVVSAYLWASRRTYGLGFPLDDAWIHQTYARNFAMTGEWAFIAGAPSAGSTAPLWTFLLVPGHLLGIEPRSWTYLMGAVLLLLTGWIAGVWLSKRIGDPGGAVRWLGLLVILEWHLAWAAVSGMEIIMLTAIIVLVFTSLEAGSVPTFKLGVLIGLGVWIRPDALSLLLPVLWHEAFSSQRSRVQTLRSWVYAGCGFLMFLVPYLLFNTSLSGTIWPSTFYAKQAEYSVMRSLPLVSRLLTQLSLPLVGVGALLAPGILVGLIRDLRHRRFTRLAPLVWVLAFLALYSLRLPVSYQHGRYAMPTIVVVLVLGLEGMLRWIRPGSSSMLLRVSSRAWPSAVAALSAAFLVIGAQAYARDVAIIETEMVKTARWISANTEQDALIAAHDIGALGYFGHRQLLDLAGLVSPEVIPILRDEQRLARFLSERGANYLMTFPDWYPYLVHIAEPVYVTNSRFSPLAGGENMMVFKWSSGGLPRE